MTYHFSFQVAIAPLLKQKRPNYGEIPRKSMRHLGTVVCSVASVVSNSVTPWTAAHQASLFMGFSRQEYWNGMPCPPPGDLPD